SATVKPTVGALNDPTLGQHVESLCCVGALDDLERNSGLLFYIVGRRLALVTAIRNGLSSEGNRLDAMAKSGAIMLRSCTSPGEIAKLIRRPSVSTAVCRFLPLIFLPASYPAESTFAPPFQRFSRFGYRRLRGLVLGPCLPVLALWHRVHDG